MKQVVFFLLEIVRIIVMFFLFYIVSGVVIFRWLYDHFDERAVLYIHMLIAFTVTFVWYRVRGKGE